MKKISLYIFFIVCSCFIFLGSVNAESGKKCYYTASGNYNTGFNATLELPTKESKKLSEKIVFKDLRYPKSGAGKGIDKIDISTIKKESEKKVKTFKTLEYYDANVKGQNKDVPVYTFKPDTFPTYVIAVFNDQNNDGMYFAGDEELKSFITSKVNENTTYNFALIGTKTKIEVNNAEDEPGYNSGDGSNSSGGNNLTDEDLETCEGMLGAKDADGNYQENTTGYLLQEIFNYMKIAALVSVFVFSVVDYAKALIQQDDQAFKTANTKTVKRIIYGVVFFLLPILVDLILKVIDTSSCGIK